MTIKTGSKNTKFLDTRWVGAMARELGFPFFNDGKRRGFITPDGVQQSLNGHTRESWALIEAQASKVPAPKEPRLERETDHLTPEEHADLVAADMNLRGGVRQLDGSLLKLKGLLMRKNAMLDNARIDAALDELGAVYQSVIDERKKRAS